MESAVKTKRTHAQNGAFRSLRIKNLKTGLKKTKNRDILNISNLLQELKNKMTEQTASQIPEQKPEDIFEQRKAKIDEFSKAGLKPFGKRFDGAISTAEALLQRV